MITSLLRLFSRGWLAFGFGRGSGSPAILPVVSVCGETSISRSPTGVTFVSRGPLGSTDIDQSITGATRISPTITGSTPISNC